MLLTTRCILNRPRAQNGVEVSYRCALLSTKHQGSCAIAGMTIQLTGTGIHSGRVVLILRIGVGCMLIKKSNVLSECEMDMEHWIMRIIIVMLKIRFRQALISPTGGFQCAMLSVNTMIFKTELTSTIVS